MVFYPGISGCYHHVSARGDVGMKEEVVGGVEQNVVWIKGSQDDGEGQNFSADFKM